MAGKTTRPKAATVTILAALLAATLAAGCGRDEGDAAQERTAVAPSTTDATTAARAEAADDATSSGSSGSAGTSAAGGSESAVRDSADGTAAKLNDAAGKAGDKLEEAGKKAGGVAADTVITTKIKAALLADDTFKGTDISVETRDGKVVLSGTVKNKSQLDRVQTLARNTEGVTDVRNQVSVAR